VDLTARDSLLKCKINGYCELAKYMVGDILRTAFY
jgi:hypothetical protein